MAHSTVCTAVRRPGARWRLPATLLLAASLSASAAACGSRPPDPAWRSSGSLGVRFLAEQTLDLSGVRLDVFNGQGLVDSRTITTNAAGSSTTGDAFFVVKPGDYKVVASPLDANGKPSASCTTTSGTAAVSAGKTTEIILSIFCSAEGTGGLDVVVTVEQGPVITGLTFDPSKFVLACAPLTIKVTAADVQKDPLAYSWSIKDRPVGAQTALSSRENTAVFRADVPGDYTLEADVTDAAGQVASMVFPVHNVGPGGCTLGPAVSFSVDPKVVPGAPIQGYQNQQLRPLVALADANGTKADFVQGELVVQTDDQAVLIGLLKRWNGTEITSFAFADAGLALPAMHLLQIDPTAADETMLVDDLAALDGNLVGQGRFSSLDAFKLMAVVAHEKRVNALAVNLNFVAKSSGLAERALAEAPSGGGGYNPNPFTWPYMRSGGAQDIGVAEAWRDLALLGILSNAGQVVDPARRVNLLVMDAGFSPNADFPASSTIFPAGSFNIANAWGCSTGAGCNWHGTEVVQTAMGQLGNGFGTAGPAGPVAIATMAQSPAGDLFQIFDYLTRALPGALGTRPRVINMSFEILLPTIAAPAVDLAGVISQGIRNSGILIYAAAGNHGIDVDHTEEFWPVTYRPTLVVPCILRGVTCVGGLGWDSSNRDPGSNYGESRDPHSGTVAIYAPFTVWMGVDPEHPANSARQANGTSFSSPFVAGVAALVMAANPALSADQVEQLIFDTAHHSSRDPSVFRWVDARAAVRAALGSPTICQPPSAAILSPADGFTVLTGTPVLFSGAGAQPAGALPGSALSWFNRGLGVGTGNSLSLSWASAGPQVITLVSHGCSAVNGQAQITVNVVAPPSTPNYSAILAPAPGSHFYVDNQDGGGWYKALQLSGAATTSSGAAVPDSRLRWSAYLGGARTLVGSGTSPVAHLYANGCNTLVYTIVLEVLDAAGSPINSLTRSVSVTIYPPPC